MNIKIIIKIQYLFREKRKIVHGFNKYIELLYEHIYGLMKRIHENYKNDIIPQYKYNIYINKLDAIITKFRTIPRPFRIHNLLKYTTIEIKDKIKIIEKDLISLSKECGSYTILDIIKLEFNENTINFLTNSDINFKKLINFYNKVFVPSSYIIYDHFEIQSKLNSVYNNSSELTVYSPKNNSQDEESYDLYNIINQKEPKCRPLKKKVTSIIEHINGTRLYIPLEYNKNTRIFKKYLVMNGYFTEDPLNVSRIGGSIGKKNSELLKLLDTIKINNNFKLGYVEQLSLRDFITYDNKEILENCYKSYKEVLALKEKTISSLVKDFLLSNIEKQRNILTLFLLMKDDIETQYLAHLMYDMITNETYLLKPQPLAEQVYNSLHWSVQKLFKIAIKRVSDYNKKLINFNEEDIPYEKRICLLKAPDYVKSKAMEKYKEIINKGNDNTAKCQQYLDGLLKIPFNVYKKEPIIGFLNNFKININLFIIELLNEMKILKEEFNLNDININNIIQLCDKYYNQNLTSKNIDEFIKNINIHIQYLCSYNLDINDNKILEILLDKFDKANKIDKYKLLIKKINDDLINYKIKPINDKGRKKELKNNIYTIISTIDILDIKKKYFHYLQNMDRNIEDISTIDEKYDKICKRYTQYKFEWDTYKNDAYKYITNTEKILDDAVYGQDNAKKEIKRIIAQWINGEMKGYCFGFEGPPGTGKTSLAKKGIANCLKDEHGNSRPFSFIALGGSSNGNTIEGHSYTYVGSTWGKIVDILIETQCMNPIIFIDELDKVSKTENGREIIGILTHLTDSTQNEEYMDKYFSGIKLDLSKALFIFSYNDFSLIDPILADRIHRVKFTHLSKYDKIHIIQNYLSPELLSTIGFDNNSIEISPDIISYIVDNYTYEAGIRKLKEKVFEIFREINLRYITNKDDNVQFPIKITKEIVEDIFSNKPKMIMKKIATKSHIGLVNGLYATTAGTGGLTIIETFKTPTDNKLSLVLTGQQGDVMQESVKCAKTIAWNIIPNDIKKSIVNEWNETGPYGIHMHCPEAATPKDGPSAGGAITLAIISLLCNIPVKNTIALTGEIDLNGSIHAIGGLDFKIEGGKSAGVELILCPAQNQQDLDIIKKDKPQTLENIKIQTISNIWEILEYCLEDNNINFIKHI